MVMTDLLLLVTQVSAVIAFILILAAVIFGWRAFFRFSGGGPFKRSILLFELFLIFFLLSVAFMFMYHLRDSGLMELLWYAGLLVALITGIFSAVYSYHFLKSISKIAKKTKLKKR